MELNVIKEYLQTLHTEMQEDILQNLLEKKKIAIIDQDEILANELWCLIKVYEIQKDYLTMFQLLKSGNYKEAWNLMNRIDISLGNLRDNFEEEMRYYHLPFINQIIKCYEDAYPNFIYSSREGIIKEEECSICGKKVLLRGGCNHIPGKLYMGELCLRKVTNYEFIGIAIVKNPLDKYSVLTFENYDYNFQILDYLMKKLDSPFRKWNIKKIKIKNSKFINIEKNKVCSCGSGKKCTNCCYNFPRKYAIHYKITLLDNEKNFKRSQR